jgi:hypothetical protein
MAIKTKQDIIDYLVTESDGQWKEEELQKRDGFGLVDAYLEWEGIIGFTTDIVNVVRASNVLNEMPEEV